MIGARKGGRMGRFAHWGAIVVTAKFCGAIALLAVSLLGPTSASAQEYRGTADQQSACMSDVFRLCSSEIPDVGRIVACLKRERPQLSEGCRAVFGGASTRVASHRARHHRRFSSGQHESAGYPRYGYQSYPAYQSWY
jgi:hypothetical protein